MAACNSANQLSEGGGYSETDHRTLTMIPERPGGKGLAHVDDGWTPDPSPLVNKTDRSFCCQPKACGTMHRLSVWRILLSELINFGKKVKAHPQSA